MEESPAYQNGRHLVKVDVGSHPVTTMHDITRTESDMHGVEQTATLHRAVGHHAIQRKAPGVRQRINALLSPLNTMIFSHVEKLPEVSESRAGVVITFMTPWKQSRTKLIRLIQETPLAPLTFA